MAAQAAATDDDLQQVCEGPRSWYLDSDEDLRQAFSKDQIDFVTSGRAAYMQYDGQGGHHKYEEGALRPGDRAPLDGIVLHRVPRDDGGALETLALGDVLVAGRPTVLDFGSFS